MRGELDRIAVDGDAARLGVDPDRAAFDLVGGVTGGAAHQRADARQHLLDMEGLGDIVVGAGVDALHLVAPAVARGEDQNGHVAPLAAPGLEHADAVHARQADVEHHRVIGLGLAEIMPLLAVTRGVDGVAGIAEGLAELAVQIGIVLDDENAHETFRSVAGDGAALGVDRDPLHLAAGAQHIDHIDEAAAATAELRRDDVAGKAAPHLAERDRLAVLHRLPRLGLREAPLRKRRPGQEEPDDDKKKREARRDHGRSSSRPE